MYYLAALTLNYKGAQIAKHYISVPQIQNEHLGIVWCQK